MVFGARLRLESVMVLHKPHGARLAVKRRGARVPACADRAALLQEQPVQVPITHLEVRRHPVWRDEVTAAAQTSRSRQVLVLGHPAAVPVATALLVIAVLAALALIAR